MLFSEFLLIIIEKYEKITSTIFYVRYLPERKCKNKMQKCNLKAYIENASFEETGFSYTLSLISGKYKMIILYCLMEYQPVRFNELQRYLGKISDKTLSQNLKELESDELIHREVYPQIPPKVEYSLTERGKSLMVVLDQLCIWGSQNRKPKKGKPGSAVSEKMEFHQEKGDAYVR